MRPKIETTIKKTHTLQLTKVQLVELLQPALDFGAPASIDHISITVRVPGGGDWSNTDLDIAEHPLEIVWTETTL